MRALIHLCIISSAFLLSQGKQAPNIRVDCSDKELSTKARRRFCYNARVERKTPKPKRDKVTTPSPLPSTALPKPLPANLLEDSSDTEPFVKPSGPIEFSVIAPTESSDWLYDEEEDCEGDGDTGDIWADFDSNCNTDRTTPAPIIRWKDLVFERLILQAWKETQSKINADMLVGGVALDPLRIDVLAGTTGGPVVDIKQSTFVYEAFLKLWDVKIHGLSTVYLSNILVTRAQNLYDFDMMAEFTIDTLTVSGTYNINGSFGGFLGSDFTSDGDRSFSLSMTNATLVPHLVLDTGEDTPTPCGKNGDVMITKLELPFKWTDISINFENLGYTYNTMINGLIVFILKTKEEEFKTTIRDKIKETINSLVCEETIMK